MQSIRKLDEKREEDNKVISIQKIKKDRADLRNAARNEVEEKDIPVRRLEKTPRQKQVERRFLSVLIMAVCVLGLSGWCVCQMIRNIHANGQVVSMSDFQNEVVENNTKNAGEKIDVDALAKKILDQVAFAVELNKLDDPVAEGMIATAPGTKLQVYMGNGTYADELVIMTASSEADAEINQKNVTSHLEEMRKQFSMYIPKEVKKIDNAVQVRCGSYVVVCVTSDTDTAKKTIDAFLK